MTFIRLTIRRISPVNGTIGRDGYSVYVYLLKNIKCDYNGPLQHFYRFKIKELKPVLYSGAFAASHIFNVQKESSNNSLV